MPWAEIKMSLVMYKRNDTRKINIGNITIGGSNKVLIQSMCNIKTEKYKEVAKQINELASLGADLMRVSIMDEKDAEAIKEIKKMEFLSKYQVFGGKAL